MEEGYKPLTRRLGIVGCSYVAQLGEYEGCLTLKKRQRIKIKGEKL